MAATVFDKGTAALATTPERSAMKGAREQEQQRQKAAKRIKIEPGDPLLDSAYDCLVCDESFRPQIKGVAVEGICPAVLKCGTCTAKPYHLSCAYGEFKTVCPVCRKPVAPWQRQSAAAGAITIAEH